MKSKIIISASILLTFYFPTFAQTISKEELIFLTSEWKGDRFTDGRPKIPDDLVNRAKNIGIEEAWTVLRNEGYNNQFERNWKMVHEDVKVVGRVLTAQFMPSRPDVEIITASGRDNLLAMGPALILCSFVHNTSGYAFGYWIGRLCNLSERDSRTIAIEVGMQNGGLASGLAKEMGKAATLGLAPAVFGPLMNITGSILASYWHRKPPIDKNQSREKEIAELKVLKT